MGHDVKIRRRSPPEAKSNQRSNHVPPTKNQTSRQRRGDREDPRQQVRLRLAVCCDHDTHTTLWRYYCCTHGVEHRRHDARCYRRLGDHGRRARCVSWRLFRPWQQQALCCGQLELRPRSSSSSRHFAARARRIWTAQLAGWTCCRTQPWQRWSTRGTYVSRVRETHTHIQMARGVQYQQRTAPSVLFI